MRTTESPCPDAQTPLQECEKRYQEFVSQSSEAICRWEQESPVSIDDPIDDQVRRIYDHGYVAECNESFARKYGLGSVQEAIGLRGPGFERIGEEEGLLRVLRFVTSGYRLQEHETVKSRADGSVRHYLTTYIGVVENRQFLRAWGISRDITDMKAIEQALRDSEEQYRGIFEGSTTGISLRRPDGTIVAANPALCRMYGYTLEEYLTKTPVDLAHPDSVKIFGELRTAALAGKQFHAEGRGIHKDGHIIDVEVYGTMVHYKGGPHVLASLQDITERKRAENQLQETAGELKKEREALKQKNIALRQILDHLEEERREYKHEICDSIEKLLMPVVETLKQNGGQLGPRDVAVLEDTLSAIIKRDIDQFQSNMDKLSPRELDIVGLIKQGLESKEIASKLNLSDQTIHKHRKLIRQKLQLRNKDVNLAAYLRSR